MRPIDVMSAARGQVLPAIVNLRTGERIPFGRRHNTLSYMASEAMAAAFGGDSSYIPARMGFIYGTEDSISAEWISRDQSWSNLKQEIREWSTGTTDVQVVDFSYQPTLGYPPSEDSGSSDSSDPEDYNPDVRNAITFHAISNSSDSGAFGGSVFTGGAGSDGMYLYQALLLGLAPASCDSERYNILARVSLKDGDVYRQKPEGFEIALDWTVIFK